MCTEGLQIPAYMGGTCTPTYTQQRCGPARRPHRAAGIHLHPDTVQLLQELPIPCESAGIGTVPSLGYIFSFGKDNSKDVFVLLSKGVYRVVRPSLCGYTCPTEKPATDNGTNTPSGPSSSGSVTWVGKSVTVALTFVVYALCF